MARKVWSETYAAGQLNADGGDQRASFVRRDFIQTYRAYITIGDKPPGLLRAITPAENANMFEVATRVQTVLAKRTAATEVAPEQITPVRAAELAAEFRSKRRSAQH